MPNKSPQPTGTKPETTTPNEAAESTDEKHSFNWGWIAWPLVVLFLYVLSFGPAARLTGHRTKPLSPVTVKFLEVFYAPVIWAGEHTFLSKPLEKYVEWWYWKGVDKAKEGGF